jgi:hypothetical protein
MTNGYYRIVYPIGCFWAKVVPTRVFNTFGVRWTFNTGPFTVKEHTVITVSLPHTHKRWC